MTTKLVWARLEGIAPKTFWPSGERRIAGIVLHEVGTYVEQNALHDEWSSSLSSPIPVDHDTRQGMENG